MSSKKEKDKEIRESINITLDETKSSVNKTTEEAKKEIPQYTKAVNEYQQETIEAKKDIADKYRKAVNEYQQETIEAKKDIADNFLESQKQVINSFQSLWVPYMENIQNSYWSYWTPQKATENYTRAVSNVTDSSIAATRMANNFIFASMEAWRTTVRHTRDNAIEISRLNANYARTLQNAALDNLRDYQARGYQRDYQTN